MPLFGRLHQVIRKAPGAYVDGRWVEPAEGPPVPVLLSVQPIGTEDYERVQGMAGGQNMAGMVRAYGSTTAPLKEGDVLLYDNARWRCLSAPPPRDTLGPETAHIRYIFTREIDPG